MTRSLVAAVRSTRGTRPVLVFLAGPNGAGKSTFFGAYLETLGLPFINADIIRDALRAAARSTTAEGFDRHNGFVVAYACEVHCARSPHAGSLPPGHLAPDFTPPTPAPDAGFAGTSPVDHIIDLETGR